MNLEPREDHVFDATGCASTAPLWRSSPPQRKVVLSPHLRRMRGMAELPYWISGLTDQLPIYRLERLEQTVAILLDRLGEDPERIPDRQLHKSVAAFTTPESGDVAYKDTTESADAPVIMIRDLATETSVRPTANTKSVDALLDDLISPDLALTLISMYVLAVPFFFFDWINVTDCRTSFLEYYGRWILYELQDDPNIILKRVNKSSLLFCACCLIAVRHTSEDLAASLAPRLYECARSLVSTNILVSPQPIEFFQGTLILCMWSTTVGQVPLSIDSWLLSGFALQHCQSSPLFTVATTQSNPPAKLDDATTDRCYLWNHLCLAHLHYCVGTSRRSTLQAWQIERCQTILDLDHAHNFEVRMVAEIHLYWTVYENLVGESVDLLKSVAALQAWKRKWEFVLGMASPRKYWAWYLTGI